MFRRLQGVGILGVFFLVGCGPGMVPVKGKISFEGQPLNTGGLVFWPDDSKGNKAKNGSFGQIAADGTFFLSTLGKPGAYPGWYKVTVTADAPPDEKNPYALPKSLIGIKYREQEKTPLLVEVVAQPKPDSYDLKLTR